MTFELPYYSESGLEIFYGTEDSAGLDLPLWDARFTKKYKEAKAASMSDDYLDRLEKKLIETESSYVHEGSITLQPMESFTIKTGVYMTIPKGCYGSLDTRSSTSKIKQDLLCHTIDSDYNKGNIRLAVINLNTEPVTLHNGQSIGQIIIQKYEKVAPKKFTDFSDYLQTLEDNERGDKGFGSTGRNV